MTAVDAGYFDGKCSEYIEGYRFIPAGEKWTREDGAVFAGEAVVPFVPFRILDTAQRDYERENSTDVESVIRESAGDYVAAYEEGVQSA